MLMLAYLIMLMLVYLMLSHLKMGHLFPAFYEGGWTDIPMGVEEGRDSCA